MSLWERVRRAFGRPNARHPEEAERLLLEADFGVAATTEILDRLSRAVDGDLHDVLERSVAALLSDGAGGDPGVLVRATRPPTGARLGVILSVIGIGPALWAASAGGAPRASRPARYQRTTSPHGGLYPIELPETPKGEQPVRRCRTAGPPGPGPGQPRGPGPAAPRW